MHCCQKYERTRLYTAEISRCYNTIIVCVNQAYFYVIPCHWCIILDFFFALGIFIKNIDTPKTAKPFSLKKKKKKKNSLTYSLLLIYFLLIPGLDDLATWLLFFPTEHWYNSEPVEKEKGVGGMPIPKIDTSKIPEVSSIKHMWTYPLVVYEVLRWYIWKRCITWSLSQLWSLA